MRNLGAKTTLLSATVACGAAFVVGTIAAPNGVTELGMPGRSNAYPSIAAAGQFVAVAWGASRSGGGTDVFVATSRDAGATFGAPTRVNDESSQASLAGEQPPRVSIVERRGGNPGLVVVWTAKADSGTRLLSARSENGGASFTSPVSLPGSEGAGNRGWHATTTAADGRTLAVWLDHREQPKRAAAGGDHTAHQHHGDGVARAQLSKLFFAPLDAGSAAVSITGGVCYCCKTAIATAADGSIYAAWRHVYPGNIRDIAFASSRDGGRTFTAPARVSDDRWVLDGCPENGPAMAVDAKGRVHIVWPTLVEGTTPGSEPTLALFHSMSGDGRHFTPRQVIPAVGLPRHPQVAVARNGELLVAWDEQGGGRRIALGWGAESATGTFGFRREVLSEGRAASYPVLAATDAGPVAAWTSGDATASTVHVARISK
jgi:hypothetical protein